jgi:pSer/pThr/pTyr-binding forkhead associated (FHA) protein
MIDLDYDDFLVFKDIGSSNGTMVDSKEIAIIAAISITDRWPCQRIWR